MGANEQGADATQNRWITIPRTLCFIFNGDDLLLMKRAPHRRIFPNQYNGVGGHIERNEDPYTGAIREMREETGLNVYDVELRGIHNIDAGAESGIMVFVFTATSDTREFTQDEREGTLHWVSKAEAMTLDLVEDLPYVLPRILTDNLLYFAHVSYDNDDQIRIQFTP